MKKALQRKAAVLLIASLLYLVMPVDLVPDLIPLIGWVDDLLVVALGVWSAFKSLPRSQPKALPR